MKKLFALFVYVSLLLLSGGQYLNAATQPTSHSSHSFQKKHRVKFTNQDTSNTLLEEGDLDLDEGQPGGDDLKDGIWNKLFIGNYSLSDNWYETIYCQPILDRYQRNFKTFAPFCGQSNPIYITHRVLRI